MSKQFIMILGVFGLLLFSGCTSVAVLDTSGLVIGGSETNFTGNYSFFYSGDNLDYIAQVSSTNDSTIYNFSYDINDNLINIEIQ